MKRKIFVITMMSMLSLGLFANTALAEEIDDYVTYEKPSDKVSETYTFTIDTKTGTITLDGKVISTKELLALNKESAMYVPLKMIVKDIYGGEIAFEKELGIISVTIGQLSFDFTLGSNIGLKNNETITVERPLIVENNTVYLPVKAMADLFDMEMAFDPVEKKIKLTGPTSFEPQLPTVFADFTFAAPSFIQGQTVTATENGYDLEGRTIVESRWAVDGNTKNTSATLSTLFTKPQVGMHTVSLKVKNDQGKWSDWVTKEIMIEANQKPTVTAINSGKDEYAQGELMSFTYQAENEEWEEIVEEKWSYKRVGEADTSKVYTCPTYIFYNGDYEVGLMVKDKYGNWSDNFTKIIHINDKVVDTELNYKFGHAVIGEVVDNYERKNYRDYEELLVSPYETVPGTYILSDSPETISQNGILYQEYIEGTARVNFNHFNNYLDNPKGRKLVVMVENVTKQEVTLTMLDKILKGPSTDALFLGQQLLFDYFKGNGNITYTLKPGERMFLIDTENKNWDYNMGFCGQFDCITSGRLKMVIAAVNKGTTTSNFDQQGLTCLPKSIHPRGTFNTTELHYNVEAPGDRPTYFALGKGAEEWAIGTDAITHEVASCSGNYGILQTIYITAKDDDIGILLNPRAGAYRGAIRINDKLNYAIPMKSYFGTDSTKAAVVTTVKKGETVKLDYMLPNGSASPIVFVLIPKKFWK